MDASSIKNILVGVAKSAAHVATGGVSDQFFDALLGPDSSLTPEAKAELQKAKIDQATAFKQIEAQTLEVQVKASTDAIIAVNQTMQVEAKSDGWLQRNWRPLFGIGMLLILLWTYIVMPVIAVWGVKGIDIPDKVYQVMMVVLGVTAATRGAEKIMRVLKPGETTDDSAS